MNFEKAAMFNMGKIQLKIFFTKICRSIYELNHFHQTYKFECQFLFLGVFFSIKQDLGALVTESNDYLIEILYYY